MPATTRSGATASGKPSNKGQPQKRGQQQKQKTNPAGRAPQQWHDTGEQYVPSQGLIVLLILSFRNDKSGSGQARGETATRVQPLSRGGTVVSIVVRCHPHTPFHRAATYANSLRSCLRTPARKSTPTPASESHPELPHG